MTAPIAIHEIDVHDEAALHQWWRTGREAADRPVDTWPAWERSRVALPTPNPERETTFLVARDGERAVASARISLPVADNLHVSYVDLWVLPDGRRAGVGSTLLHDIERRVRDAGRTTILADAYGAPGTTPAGLGFGLARGFEVANTEDIKVLDLADLDERREPLGADVAERIGDYTIVRCQDIPDEHMDGFCRLMSGFMSQIPLGDLALADSEWTGERVRAWEERARVTSLESYVALALSADGAVVGTSDVNISLLDPARASVGLTIVDADHRGHRLGLAMKLANHADLRAAHPGCARVETSNAGVNEHMNAVNEQMGYRVSETCHEMQRTL